jgi:hypothetical protein
LNSPTVTGVTTLDGSVTLHNGSSIPQPDTIAIAFSKPMDTYTINSTTIQLQGVASYKVTYSPSTQTAYVTPESTLSPGTTYHLVINTGVTDDQGFPSTGVPLAPFSSLAFTVTGGATNHAPLTITATNPVDGTARTTPLGYVSVNFSEAINFGSFQRFSAMLIPQTGGVTTGGSGYADVPYDAKLAFNPNTNQLIIVPTGFLTDSVVDLIAISPTQVKGSNGTDPLTDAHVPPGYRTFLLRLSPASSIATRASVSAADFATPPLPAAPVLTTPAPASSNTAGVITLGPVSSAARRGRPAQALLSTRVPGGPLGAQP